MDIYFPPSLRHLEPKHFVVSGWIDHIPFGYDIVEAVKPRLLVELGTMRGLSYFIFCQSMKEHDIDGVCYAVDTWAGDEHTGACDESVLTEVNSHNREFYQGFSYLRQTTFDEALQHFDEDTIDLLHLDGLHTEEAVRQDFEDWYPRVKPGGLILFHDISSRMMDFGVWRAWAEIEAEHDTFAFHHGFGLGVLRKPGGPALTPESQLLYLMFHGSEEEHSQLRRFYVHAARYHELIRKLGPGQFGLRRKEVLARRAKETQQKAGS